MRIRDSYHLYAFITVLCWSLIFVLTRIMMPEVSSASIGALRCVIASVTMMIALALMSSRLPRMKDIPLFLLTGFVGFYLYLLMFNEGLKTANSSMGSVIIATSPIITAVLANLLHKERLRLFQWLSMALSLIGVIVLSMMRDSTSALTGILWLVAAAFLISYYNILQRSLSRRYTALETATYSMVGGTIFYLFHLPKAISEMQNVPLIYVFYILILGVFSSAIAYVMWTKALSRAELASQVTNYMFVTPFLSSFWGFVLAGEMVSKATLAGGALILAGLFFFNWGEAILTIWSSR